VNSGWELDLAADRSCDLWFLPVAGAGIAGFFLVVIAAGADRDLPVPRLKRRLGHRPAEFGVILSLPRISLKSNHFRAQGRATFEQSCTMV
jgi:hypothetical protein